MSVTIECQKRPEGINPRALRRQGLIPANLYGHKGTESDLLVVNAKAAEQLLKQASLNNTLIDVAVPELSWQGKALIREVQTHPWKPFVYHLSFFAVKGHGDLAAVVPINLVGNAQGVKQGGILEQVITEIQVKCPPEQIPESIDVDISHMDTGETLHIRDLILPEGIEAEDDPERTILTIVPPRTATTEVETVDTAEVVEETTTEV